MSTQRKAPFRPRQKAEITQEFNDGIVKIYWEIDTSQSGHMPEPTPDLTHTLCYQERKVGIRRYYDAKQNQIHVERVIRVPCYPGMIINNQFVAQMEDNFLYRIDLVQKVMDVYPPCMDLTLVKYYQSGFTPRPLPPIPLIGEGGDGNA